MKKAGFILKILSVDSKNHRQTDKNWQMGTKKWHVNKSKACLWMKWDMFYFY